jgi:non-specific serine/threonine protein kinase
MGRALHGLGVLAAAQGDMASAHVQIEEGLSLALAVGDLQFVGLALHNLGIFAVQENDEETARSRIEESRRVWQELGSTGGLSLAANSLGDLARSRGKYAEAAAHYRESLELIGEAGLRGWRANYLHNLGYVTHRQGDDRQARALFAEALFLCREVSDRLGVAECLAGLASLVAETQPVRTARLFGSAMAAVEAMGSRLNWSPQADHEHSLASARRCLGDQAFEAAWANGRSLTLEQAITYALEDAHASAARK